MASAAPTGTAIGDFDYELPPKSIAQAPAEPRDSSRLMLLRRDRQDLVDSRFARLGDWLRPGDVLVRNDTRVFAARLRGRRSGGGACEILLVRHLASDGGEETWTCLARPGRRLRAGDRVELPAGMVGTLESEGGDDGCRRLRIRTSRPVLQLLEEVGEVPLPPYIQRPPDGRDREAYQTVYARTVGSVAAPTAGLHFTPDLFAELARRGVEIRSLTLHVGPGTFLPVRVDLVERHRMLPEEAQIPAETCRAIFAARSEGRRVIAVGTTTVRALEGLLRDDDAGPLHGSVSLFIHPGFVFRVVDGLITNFHLPRSTLLMLVCAFAGRDRVLGVYREALRRGYRFFSYGDAMLIL